MEAKRTRRFRDGKHSRHQSLVTVREHRLLAVYGSTYTQPKAIKTPFPQIKQMRQERNLSLNLDPRIRKSADDLPFIVPKLGRELKPNETLTSKSMTKSIAKPYMAEPYMQKYVNGPYKYIIYRGNNSDLIEEQLKTRGWISGDKERPYDFQLIWTPSSRNIRFHRLAPRYSTQMVNHLEFHKEITQKVNLLRNMTKQWRKAEKSVHYYIPLTFELRLNSSQFQNQEKAFKTVFNSPEAYLIPSQYDGSNAWVLKPTGYNRGIGIHVFNDINTFDSLLQNYREALMYSTIRKSKSACSSFDIKNVRSVKFVVQKYIEKPMLIDNRKFDIRMWVMVKDDMTVYVFKEGYLRTSSHEFKLTDYNDPYIHLTNNAIQKRGDHYGQHEQGNQLSFRDFAAHLPENGLKGINAQIKEMIITSLKSVSSKLNARNRQYCFEIFGYDFMVDEKYKVWLLEVNTNPCLEESSTLLEQLLPRMIDDAFKLTVDLIFPPQITPRKVKTAQVIELPDENLWELVANLSD